MNHLTEEWKNVVADTLSIRQRQAFITNKLDGLVRRYLKEIKNYNYSRFTYELKCENVKYVTVYVEFWFRNECDDIRTLNIPYEYFDDPEGFAKSKEEKRKALEKTKAENAIIAEKQRKERYEQEEREHLQSLLEKYPDVKNNP